MKVAVIGRGAWGRALATVAERGGPTTDDPGAADAIVLAVSTSQIAARMGAIAPRDRPVLICAKGLEPVSARLPFEIARAISPDTPVGVLSGPTFAHEVAAGLPAAALLASVDVSSAEAWIARLAVPGFRLYAGDDPIGASVGGAVKNVIAIAAGVVAGRGLGENARAALIARGLAEMVRYARARGGQEATLMGLSGLGDLVLTCGSERSRNMAFGIALGRGSTAVAAFAVADGVVEGAATAPTLAADAAERGVEMPIVNAVADLLTDRAEVSTAIERLLARPQRAEGW